MRPPVRPPQLRCVFFSSMYLPHLLVLPATFWTSVPFATLSVFPSLICGSCPSGQRFAYSFFQIPSHGGHPCCSAMCFVVAYAHLGLSPIRKRPCWANKIGTAAFKLLYLYYILTYFHCKMLIMSTRPFVFRISLLWAQPAQLRPTSRVSITGPFSDELIRQGLI